MPMKYVEPELYLTHKGIDIYHTYEYDITNRREYWFSTDRIEDNEDFQFDIRALFKKVTGIEDREPELKEFEKTIRTALDEFMLRIPLWQKVRRIGNLCLIDHDNTKTMNDLIDFACRQTAETVKSLKLNEQIVFLLSQLGDTTEELVRQAVESELKKDASRTETV